MPDGNLPEPISYQHAATDYLSLGWRVFPLAAGSHVPLGGSDGHKNATRNIDTVLGWWGDNGNMKFANIGIATGRLSGIWVLDVDNHGGDEQNGFITLKALTEANGELPDTVTAMSPRGGMHLYFKVPEDFDISSKAGILGAGLDSRSSGGYIVAPPSIRADRGNIRYAWAPGKSPKDLDVAETPAWMLEIIREQNRKETAGEHDEKRIADTLRLLENPAFKASMTNYARKGLDFELENIRDAARGTGNDTLFRSAFKVGQLIGMGLLDEVSVRQELLSAAMERGRSEHESNDVIARAVAKGKNLPRQLPNAPGGKKTKRKMMTLDQAQTTLEHINIQIAQGNFEFAFERESLDVFATLREFKRADWEKIKADLGKSGISKRDLEAEVKKIRRELETDFEIEERKRKTATINECEIVFLGKSDGNYFYMSSTERLVVELSRDGHHKTALLSLAPLSFWQAKFEKYVGKHEELTVDWDAAIDWMFRQSDKAPMFDIASVKGVGMHLDGSRIVVNAGSCLYIDGIQVDFKNYKPVEQIIFEKRPSVKVDFENPLSTAEAQRIVEHILSLPFESFAVAHAVAGWAVLAPFSGLIEPRAHLYVTGESGAGKSRLQNDIIKALNFNMRNEAAATTTAAAIRMDNRNDSKPNFIDEFEGTTEKSRDRVDAILELLRNAFDGGIDKKGSATGKGVRQYRLTQMYCVSSIVPQLALAADKNRIINASLLKFPGGPAGEKIKQDFREIFGDASPVSKAKLSSRFLARIFLNAARTLRTIDVFAEITSEYIAKIRGQKMYANLFGALYAFANDKVPSVEEARAFLVKADFSGEIYEDAASASEHDDLVTTLLSARITHQFLDANGITDKKVRVKDLAIATFCDLSMEGLDAEAAEKTLVKHGMKMVTIKVEDRAGFPKKLRRLAISNTDPELSKIFANTRWRSGWSSVLKAHRCFIHGRHDPIRIDGALRRVSFLDADELFKEDRIEIYERQQQQELSQQQSKKTPTQTFSFDLIEIKNALSIVNAGQENEYV